MIGIAVVAAPWGPIHLAADEDALLGLEVLTTAEAFAGSTRRRLGGLVAPPGSSVERATRRRLEAAADAVAAHLAGERRAFAGVAVELRGISAWDQQVLAGVRRIPWGEATSYGRLARSIGRPGAARAAGAAVGRNPIGLVLPCHRVIAGDGSLGGYGGAWFGEREALLAIKRHLLAIEAIALPVRTFVG
jgi:methylated-DNA-[protein]-cysteine S-methyltransferase